MAAIQRIKGLFETTRERIPCSKESGNGKIIFSIQVGWLSFWGGIWDFSIILSEERSLVGWVRERLSRIKIQPWRKLPKFILDRTITLAEKYLVWSHLSNE